MTMIHERVGATRVYDASLMTEIKSKVGNEGRES